MAGNEVVVKQLIPYAKERINLEANTKFYGKILSESKEKPLRITITVVKGIGHINLYISEFIEHLFHNHCDLETCLKKKNNIIIYTGTGNECAFKRKKIFIAFEAEKESIIFFDCYFGKLASSRTSCTFIQHTEHRNSIMSINDVYTHINQLKKNENDLKRFNQEVKEIIKKRKERNLLLSGRVNILKRNKELDCFTGCLKDNIEDLKALQAKKSKNALILRRRSESIMAMKKFIFVHRHRINHLLVFPYCYYRMG